MEMEGLYISLGLNSYLERDFAEARKIVAGNMAKLQREMRDLSYEISAIDSGMHVAGHWTEEDLKRTRQVEVDISVDDEELENLNDEFKEARKIEVDVSVDNEELEKTEEEIRRLKREFVKPLFKSVVIRPDNETLEKLKYEVLHYKRLLAEINLTEQYGGTSYAKKMAKLNAAYDSVMERYRRLHYDEGQEIYGKFYAAKVEQIEQERATKLKEIREGVTSADKTALEQKLESIEKERQAWLKAGMDEAESVELAQKKNRRGISRGSTKGAGALAQRHRYSIRDDAHGI